MGFDCCIGHGIDAADEILKSVYRIDIRKSLDPLNHGDYEKICAHLAGALKGVAQPIEAKAYGAAIQSLDVDWAKMSAAQRQKVLDAAKAHLAPMLTIPSKISQTLEVNAKDIYGKTKKNSVHKFDINIDSTFNQADEKAIAFVAKSQSNYVRDAQVQARRSVRPADARGCRRFVEEGFGTGAPRSQSGLAGVAPQLPAAHRRLLEHDRDGAREPRAHGVAASELRRGRDRSLRVVECWRMR